MEIGKIPVALVQIEPVADEKLVRHREADVADGEVFDQAPVGPVEEGHGRKGGRRAERKGLAEVVQGQAGVDDVLDYDDMPAGELGVEILQQADPCMAALVGARRVAGELEEVEPVWDPEGPREVGDEDEARLQGRDEQRREALVLASQLPPELADARRQLLTSEVDLAEARAA